MDALSRGEKIPNATMANETVELMNRAAKDESLTKLSEDVAGLEAKRDILSKLTAESLSSKVERNEELNRRINDIDKLGKDKNDPERVELVKQRDQLALELKPFLEVYKGDRQPKGELRELTDRLRAIDRSIRLLRDHPDDTPERRAEKATERAAKQAERKTVLEKLLPEMQMAINQELEASSSRKESFEQLLLERRRDFDADPYKFWSTNRKAVLDDIEAISDKQTRKTLEDAFSGGLSDKLKSWTDILTKDRNPKPEKMQSLALEVVTMADKYIHIVQEILRNPDSDPAIAELRDKLVAALSAIRFSVSKDLSFQFENGRFN